MPCDAETAMGVTRQQALEVMTTKGKNGDTAEVMDNKQFRHMLRIHVHL